MFTTFGYLAAVAGHIISRLVDIVVVVVLLNNREDDNDNDHNNNNEKAH